VNDRFGHRAGDAALQAIAAALRDQVIRRGDVVARLGGDEFGLIISRADEAQAQVVAHRALEAIRSVKLDFEGEDVALGGSIGVATFRAGDDADEVLAHADAAMYFAKQNLLGVVAYRRGLALTG
jgi:diguanylate cyclase (GGDEF)-like protein